MNFDDGRWGRLAGAAISAQVDGRPDVMSYTSPVLTKTVKVSGVPMADIFAKTTGTDGDFVGEADRRLSRRSRQQYQKMGGYPAARSASTSSAGAIATASRNRAAIPPGKVQEYKFRLPAVNHVFLPGHRIMVQVQSSLFPLYDRNPQTFVPNIFLAKPGDYKKATVSIERGGATAERGAAAGGVRGRVRPGVTPGDRAVLGALPFVVALYEGREAGA